MIKPGEIPQYTGNLELLEKAHGNLTKDAGHIRDTGADVHTHFQGLSAYYKAPEAERLFASTKPVKDRADGFADDLGKVSSALSEYTTEIRPLVTKLTQLKADATTFVNDNKDDDDWEYDGDKVDEHNQLRDDITSTVAAFWAAERTCHNKITALFGGTQMVAGDGSDRKNQYGFAADDLKNAKLPWGDPVEEKHHAWEIGHWVKSFVWDGIIVDGVWGTIKGLGTLVGVDGWDAMGQAWKGLAQLGTGLAISTIPGAREAFWSASDDQLPSWLRDSRNTMKQTGKALVAWDEWGKNPGRAAGAVTFNVVTTVFTGGAGGAAAGAGKAGAVAKVLSATGKVGRVIDPMTYVAKGAGAGLSKIGDIAKGLKGIGKIDVPELPEGTVTLPEGSLLSPDGTVHPPGTAVPEGAIKIPEGSVKLPDGGPVLPPDTVKLPGDGAPKYMDTEGNIYKADGTLDNDVRQAPTDTVDRPTNPTTGADTPRVDTLAQEPALAGAGTRTADNAIHTGESTTANSPIDTERSGGDIAQRGTHSGDSNLSDSGHSTEHNTTDGPHTNSPDSHHNPPEGLNGSDHTTPNGEERVPEGHDESAISDPEPAVGHDAADMATRRDFKARIAPESTIPAPPKEPGDIVLDTGDPVYFRDGRTAIGYDKNTRVNFDNVQSLNGYHDVVVHGNNQGFFAPGRVNETGSGFTAGDTHPTHIADAIRANPSYDGGPVRLVSCHTGTIAEGALDIPAAQSIANELGVPVMAPTNKVGVNSRLGPGQTPNIHDGGYWRTFLPIVQ
ncbi:hypothetical protein ABZ370_01000 [Streptomyces sp. NPDC005962]|uniref:hypothetical protein n=1 Tax=Streptomyces sp. NPDC005962 TaxID=3154466 RepID=UPI0033CA7AF9